MSISREIPPTAGWRLYAKDLFSPIFRTSRDCLENDFQRYLNVPYAHVTYSGTAAFYLILESLEALSPKRTVVIPAFVCPLVVLAIQRAGLKTLVCDINKNNFNFDAGQLEELCRKNRDILAIVPVHLAGIPVEMEALTKIARACGAYIIEDCAQSLGTTYKDKLVGNWGDFSFFSLCRGKGLTIYEGGVIVCNNKEYSAAINNAIKRLEKSDLFSEGLKIIELFGYWLFYRPQLFWYVYRLPQNFWYWQNKPLRALIEYFTMDFPVHRVSQFRKSVGHASFRRLEQQLNGQRQRADWYMQGLSGIPGLKLITEPPNTRATYPYLTLLFDEPLLCQKAKMVFKSDGWGISQIYNCAIIDYDYLEGMVQYKNSCPNARSLAQRQITLSTSIFLTKRYVDEIIEALRNLRTD